MSWHTKKMYINGKVVHPRGGGILLDGKRGVEATANASPHVGIVEPGHIAVKGNGLTSLALKRLEELRPREIGIPKRPNIKF